jgi:hypothetical protein
MLSPGRDDATAQECLSLWGSSGGKCMKPMSIRSKVRNHLESVLVLISTSNDGG